MERRRYSNREDLLQRWKGIEEEEDDQDEGSSFPSKQRTIQRMKEKWFSDAFHFLNGSPVETHLWCGFWDLMGPLLETFYSYYKDEKPDSPLKLVWRRVSREFRQCTQCICLHHQAQETYSVEYELETVGPLLKTLQRLDEERLTEHLQEINARISQGAYDPESHGAEVISIMFEVLMFPILLDDQSLVAEFERFIEAIDNSHELSLAGHQQYPGVYALLFFRNSRVRATGLRLAGCLGKLRKAADLEPLQPLLRKCMVFFEAEVLPEDLDSSTSRPRVCLERMTAWLGLKALIGFLESPAFEEGILEKHPIFLSSVLNHVSDDTPEFSHAVTCLRLFFEMLGCKLWLRTTLSPSMMRNTLLGQCFHTQDEKIHKEIFDLFLPFLQSLEALQDDEHEKQRRHLLYFLLHQVTHSSNFSTLMRKNACKIAFLAIQRGYVMNPPCPPFECSHMWGPSLVSSLRDVSLHDSLRKPAFDLIQTIVVSDCAALASIRLNFASSIADAKIFYDLYDEDDTYLSHILGEISSCWDTFCFQSKIVGEAYKEWKCIPMLWLDVFVGIDPLLLPVSFSKAVIWAVSHLPFFDLDINMESKLSVCDWLSSYAGEISDSFLWEVPKGYDDGGYGKVPKSSVNASLMCFPLLKAFKRCAAHYITLMEQRQLQKQWTWEPQMAESLILLLISPIDTIRRINRIILEHVSKTRGLTSGIQFLCSNVSSFSSMYVGLKYATLQVQLDCNPSIFCNLHHLFFILGKLLKVDTSPQQPDNDLNVESTQMSHLSLSCEGGFLRQPCRVISTVRVPEHSSSLVDVKAWNTFSRLISTVMWPSVLKCLVEGKTFIDQKNCQMTSVRLLEIVPVLFERISASGFQHSHSVKTPSGFCDFNWIVDLVDWGRSSLVVVIRHWKQSILYLINLLRKFHDGTECPIDAIEKIMSRDIVVVDELKKLLSQFSLSLSKKSLASGGGYSKAASSVFAASCLGREVFATDISIGGSVCSQLNNLSSSDEEKVEKKEKHTIIIVSDDEDEKIPTLGPIPSPTIGSLHEKNEIYADESMVPSAQIQQCHVSQESVTVTQIGTKHSTFTKVGNDSGEACHQQSNISSKLLPVADSSLVNSITDPGLQGMRNSQFKGDILPTLKAAPAIGTSFGRSVIHKTAEQSFSSKSINTNETNSVINEISVANDDSLDLAVTSTGRSNSLITKPLISVPKRKVVQLEMPMNNKVRQSSRVNTGCRSLRPPKLDDWYRPILELDYFCLISSCYGKKEDITPNLKPVPLCFHSKENYVEIFQPLVLEEFKAQLHSSYVEASLSEDICSGVLRVLSVERIDDFHLVRGSPEKCELSASREYSENDLVLLTKEPLQKTSQSLHALGKVERRERNNKTQATILSIRVYIQSVLPRLIKVKKFLIERSKWYISRIMSITPQLREFQALSSLNNIPLLPLILNPTDVTLSYNEPRKDQIDKLPLPMQQTLKSSYNKNQIQAISAAIGRQDPTKSFQLSLIQGPPGTGKTRTIVAIVSALLAVGSSKSVSSKTFNNTSSSGDTAFISSRAQVSQATAIARAWQDAALAKQIAIDEVKDYSGLKLRSLKTRVLICAQSNAAVDELVSRINLGVIGVDGNIYKPFLVRVGNVKTVHPNSLPFFIDTLVEQRLAEDKSISDRSDVDMNSSNLRIKLEKIVDSIRLYESKRVKARDSSIEMNSPKDGTPHVDDVNEISDTEIGAKLSSLYAQKRCICRDIAMAQAHESKSFEERKVLKIKTRRSIIREAEIVVTTLSGCGGDIYGACSDYASFDKMTNFSESSLFDAVVIDEAAQALEPATLIPLQLLKSNGIKCVMVGDPKQLPATVLSGIASKHLYECSMFERLQRAGYPLVMLNEQYRMHPDICKFPSCHFYEDKLVNGADMAKNAAPFHENSFLGPYLVFDIIDGRECQGKMSGSLSLSNEAEAEAVVEILKFFRKRYSSEFLARRIGLITPYKRQLSVLRSWCNNEFGTSVTGNMEFNTVDGFQGREVDILLLSTVRASDPNSRKKAINSSLLGFVADVRRMNVALTRAKLSLWIIGNSRTLQTNPHWDSLIKDAKERDLFISLSRPYKSCMERSSSSNGKNMPTISYSHTRGGKMPHGGNHKEGKAKPMNWEKEKHKVKHGFGYEKQKMSLTADLSSDHHIMKQKTSASTLTKKHTENIGAKDKVTQRKEFDSADNNYDRREKIKSIDIKSATRIKRRKEKTTHETVDVSSSNKSQMKCTDSKPCNRPPEKEADREKHDDNHDTAHKSLIASRKRQREVVDSLLSSSLISSRKTGGSSRTAHFRKADSEITSDREAIPPIKPKKLTNKKRHFDG